MLFRSEVFTLISRIASEHSRKPFGYLTQQDMVSEIWAICLTAIKEFDISRGKPLEHFLRASVKNRLINRFKELTRSVRTPCLRCPYYKPEKAPNDC